MHIFLGIFIFPHQIFPSKSLIMHRFLNKCVFYHHRTKHLLNAPPRSPLKAGQGIQAKSNKGVVLSTKSRRSFQMPACLKKILFGTGVAKWFSDQFHFYLYDKISR